MTSRIETPDVMFVGIYYPQLLDYLVLDMRVNWPGVDEDPREPLMQFTRANALIGHYSHVLLDVVAGESIYGTSRLLESVRNHLKLINQKPDEYSPAVVEILYKLGRVFTTSTNVLPRYAQVSNEEDEETPLVVYETLESLTINRTDQLDGVFGEEISSEYTDGATLSSIPNEFTSSSYTFTAGDVGSYIVVVSSVSGNYGRYRISTFVDANTVRVKDLDGNDANFTTENNITFVVYEPTSNLNTEANSDAGSTLTPWTTVKDGNCFYIGHEHIMFNKVAIDIDTPGDVDAGTWEYFDDNFQDVEPNSVVNNGPDMTFGINNLVGTTTKEGKLIKVTYLETGAFEIVKSEWVGGENKITTQGTLGQAIPSTVTSDYMIGTDWNDLEATDGTNNLSQDGDVEFDLPQTIDKNWQKSTLFGIEGYWIRFRVIDKGSAVSPVIERIQTDTGDQYILAESTQGEYTTEDPLGSSNEQPNQEFELANKYLIPESLTVEVEEGGVWSYWSVYEDFFNSASTSKHVTYEIDAYDNAKIIFGDGVNGKIPLTGVDNLRCSYRVNANNDGNLGANTITVNKTGVSYFSEVTNPRAAYGWIRKEGTADSIEERKLAITRLKVTKPQALQARRAISAPDVQIMSVNYRTSGGTQLVIRSLGIEEGYGVKTIENVVVGQGGTLLTANQLTEIDEHFNGTDAEDSITCYNHEVVTTNYTPRVITIEAEVTGGDQTEIENLISALLNPGKLQDDEITFEWDFGGTVPRSRIIHEIHKVSGVTNVNLIQPASDVSLNTKELPLIGTLTITML